MTNSNNDSNRSRLRESFKLVKQSALTSAKGNAVIGAMVAAYATRYHPGFIALGALGGFALGSVGNVVSGYLSREPEISNTYRQSVQHIQNLADIENQRNAVVNNNWSDRVLTEQPRGR